MLNPTRKIQLANPFMHCPPKTTTIPPQTRPQIQQKRQPLTSSLSKSALISWSYHHRRELVPRRLSPFLQRSKIERSVLM